MAGIDDSGRSTHVAMSTAKPREKRKEDILE